jgi:hypothetical protein
MRDAVPVREVGKAHSAFPRWAGSALVVPCALAVAFAAAAAPNLDGFWGPKLERKPSGQALIDELPKGVALIADTGAKELAAGDFAGLKLSARALEEVRNYDYKKELDPENNCTAPSVAFYMQAPFPMEIYQGRDLIVLKMEYMDMMRVVFLDGRPHPPETAPHSKSGFSTGHWEGDTLVVETSHIEAGTFMNNGFNHSDALRLTERFRPSPDGNTLWAVQIYDDPQTFDGRAARYMAWTRRPGEYVFPYECDPGYRK